MRSLVQYQAALPESPRPCSRHFQKGDNHVGESAWSPRISGSRIMCSISFLSSDYIMPGDRRAAVEPVQRRYSDLGHDLRLPTSRA